MKILIRDKSRNLYLAMRGRWETDAKLGQDFEKASSAISHIAEARLTGVELYYVFPDPAYNFSVPLVAFDAPKTVGNGQVNGPVRRPEPA